MVYRKTQNFGNGKYWWMTYNLPMFFSTNYFNQLEIISACSSIRKYFPLKHLERWIRQCLKFCAIWYILHSWNWGMWSYQYITHARTRTEFQTEFIMMTSQNVFFSFQKIPSRQVHQKYNFHSLHKPNDTTTNTGTMSYNTVGDVPK